MRWIVGPGFFSNHAVQVAMLVGGVVAVVSAVVGVFTVLRGQSFAGHALTDVSTAGGSGALLLGMSPLFGFVAGGVAGAGAMEGIGVQRLRGRDLATGVVLGASTGFAALFLYLDSSTRATTGATQQILFGSIFTIDSATIPVVVGIGCLTLAVSALVSRPLLLSSTSPELAVARGVPLRLVGALFMLTLALSVGLSSVVVGSILSTALLIGPAATALRLTRALATAVAAACAIGVAVTWIGILLAYDSVSWSRGHQGLPVSFFIVAVTFAAYLASGLPVLHARSRGRTAGGPATAVAGR